MFRSVIVNKCCSKAPELHFNYKQHVDAVCPDIHIANT